MKTYRIAIVGLGATGTVLAAALLRKDPNTILVGRSNDINQAVAYLEKAGVHKDSMCADIEHRKPTEIGFLGGKVVAYAREAGISVPFLTTMTNLVKALESSYLDK